MSSNFSAAIFDLDGTLVQSEHLHRVSWIEPLGNLGIIVDDATYFRDFAGKPGKQIIEEHLGLRDPDVVDRLYNDVTDAYWSLADRSEPTHGLLSFLGLIADWPKAVCTSAQHDSAHRMLALLGIQQLFAAVVTASDVQHGKPDPEPFLLAASRIGVAPVRCLAFEDSANGLRSARAAGMYCVGIGNGLTHYAELADRWIVDFADDALDDLITP